jgi:hypothetical protein
MSRRGANPRYANGNARRKLRARLRAMYERCPVCGATLDWNHPYLPNSAELDEIVPVSRLPEELRRRACLDPDNAQVSAALDGDRSMLLALGKQSLGQNFDSTIFRLPCRGRVTMRYE